MSTANCGMQVTLVHSGPRLLDQSANPKGGAHVHRILEGRGAKILINDRVEGNSTTGYTTKSGAKVDADLVFWCTGSKACTSFLPPAWLDDKGLVKVDQFFCVKGAVDVFAIGDITNIPEPKMAIMAMAHAEALPKILLRPSKKKPYTPGNGMPNVRPSAHFMPCLPGQLWQRATCS